MEGQFPSPQPVTHSSETKDGNGLLKIISYNCKNMETAQCAIEDLSKKADVILIQEHWYFDCQLGKLNTVCEGFSSSGKAVDTGSPILPVQMPRGYGGTAILWRKSIDHLVTSLPDGCNRIQCIEIAGQFPIILVSIYMPCKGLRENVEEFTECIDQLQEIYTKYSNTHTVIFGGDFNEDLGVVKDSERKRRLKGLLQDCNLATRETEKTYTNPDGIEISTIDYIFFPACIEEKVQAVTRLDETDSNVSDHMPLLCTLKVDLSRVKQEKTVSMTSAKVRWDKIDKEEYRIKVSEQLSSVNGKAESLCSLDNEISKLNDILLRSSKSQHKRAAKQYKKPKLKVWTPEIQHAIKDKKEAFCEWKHKGRPNLKDHWLVVNKKVATYNLRKLCRIESARQRQTVRQEILDARYENTRLFHKLISRQRGGAAQCVNELHVGDKVFHTKAGILEGFREHFENLATPSNDKSFDQGYSDLVKLEVKEIQDMCSERLGDEASQVTQEQVKRAISSLNTGKSADIYGVTAEHFVYGGDELLQVVTDLINNLYRKGSLTECMKTGVLTPVFKKKGSHIEAKNYRGITILPTITKILEAVLKDTIRPAVAAMQNNLQRGFTQNSSPMNGSLILEEAIRESRDRKQPLYIAFLDVKAAFDVVSHESLLRKLFHIGLEGAEWSLVQSLHCDASSVIKWEGAISDNFQVLQGVRQGGILSTDLYKLYGNNQLDRIQDKGDGFHIGEICCAAPTVADDIAMGSSSLDVLQSLVSTAVDNSKLEKYILQPAKSVILAAVMPYKRAWEKEPEINITMDGVRMPVVEEAMHMGILRSANSQESTVNHNIQKSRRTAYCLMGAGLHGSNGLDPETSIHILQTYIVPILAYGLEVLLPGKTLMNRVERFYKKLLKQILSLPDTAADPAVYILTGSLSIEGIIHSRALTLFGNVCRLSEDSIEKQIARRQVSIKGDRSFSWFIDMKTILLKYSLPLPWDLLESPPTKSGWKRTVKQRVEAYWAEVFQSRATLYPSLGYLNCKSYKPGVRPTVIQDPSGVKDVPRIHTKTRLLTGTYILQTNRASFNQNQIDPVCLLCKKENETLEHFILHCDALEHIKSPIISDIQKICNETGVISDLNNSNNMLQLILDCSVILSDGETRDIDIKLIERQTRRLCHALHVERFRRLPQTVTKRKRPKK